MQRNPNKEDMMRIAQSPSGQKLMALLQKQGGTSVQEALTSAQKGNYDAAKQSLSALLASEEVRNLLRDLEGKL